MCYASLKHKVYLHELLQNHSAELSPNCFLTSNTPRKCDTIQTPPNMYFRLVRERHRQVYDRLRDNEMDKAS
jgi:hypothetical protein